METSINKKLVNLLETTQNPKTKRVVTGLMEVIKSGEMPDEKAVGIVSESLRKLKSDKVVESFFNDLNNRASLNNLGLKSLIATAKKTALYENDMEARELVDNYAEYLNEYSEYQLVDTFIPQIKRYAWNKAIGASTKVVETKTEKFKAYKLVAETIGVLENDKNPEFYTDTVIKLDRAFSLPENQVRHYLATTLQEMEEVHPAVTELIKNLTLLEKHTTGGYSNLSKVTYVTDRHQGRVKAQERIAPALFEDNRDIVLINNSLYEIKDKKINEVKDVRGAGIPTDFVRICETFLKFTPDGNRLKISDDVYEFAIVLNEGLDIDKVKSVLSDFEGDYSMDTDGVTILNQEKEDEIGNALDAAGFKVKMKGDKILLEDENDVQIEVDGEVQEGEMNDVYADLGTMGINPDIINLIKDMVANIDDVTLMDNIVTVCPVDKGVIIDIIKLNPDDCDVYVNICDVSAGINDLTSATADPSVVTQVSQDYGVDITPFTEEEEAEPTPNPEEEAAKKEKEEELQKHKDQLEEVISNLEKIEMLDDDYKEDEEVATLKTQLEEQKGGLLEKIKEMEIEMNGGEPAPDDLDTLTEKIYDEFNDMISNNDYVAELRESEDPNASTIKSGGVYQVSETVSVIPVVEFEKVPADDDGDEGDEFNPANNEGEGVDGDGAMPVDGDGEVTGGGKNDKVNGTEKVILANAYLQVQDSSVEENDDAELEDKFDNTKYTAMEDGYVNLGVEPMDHEEELPDTVKEDISNVLNTVAPTDDDGDQIDETDDGEEDETDEGFLNLHRPRKK